MHRVLSAVVASVLAAGGVSGGAAAAWGQPRVEAAQAQPGKPVNNVCPIKGGEVDPEAPMREWRGRLIGFCCPGCESKWDARSDAEKDAFLAKFAESPAAALARRFQEGMEAADLAAIDALFLGNGRASVLENGTDEGAWERYREEHLRPELQELAGYRWRPEAVSESELGGVTVVRQTGEFSFGPADGRKHSRAAITFVVVEEGGVKKIAHLHWSSRPVKSEQK